MQQRQLSLAVLFITLAAACSSGPEQPAPPRPRPPQRPKPSEVSARDGGRRRRGASRRRLRGDALREKTLIYHLYQAALAGRDIFIDQKHRYALEMRAVLEAVITHPQGLDAATRSEERYTKLFWVNNGPYNNLTARKFVLKTTPMALTAAVKAAVQAGATVPTPAGESLDAMLARLTRVLRRQRGTDRHQQGAGPGQGHPAGQRQQSLFRRLSRKPKRSRRPASRRTG